jgi:acyl-CoA thioesterase-2
VTASQDGRPVFLLTASFHAIVEGALEHSPPPDGPPLADRPDLAHLLDGDRWLAAIRGSLPFALRFPVEPVRLAVRRGERPPARQEVLLRWPDLPDDELAHRAAAAFMSDALLLSTSTFPHGRLFDEPDVQGLSLDHTIWFHRPFRADRWLLHRMESPWAGQGRALSRGALYDDDGLVATVVQEGLVRVVG